MQMPIMEDDHVSGNILGGELSSNEEIAKGKSTAEKGNDEK